MHMLTLFSIKTNLRENRFFAARCAIGEQKATHNVKFYDKYFTIGETFTDVKPNNV